MEELKEKIARAIYERRYGLDAKPWSLLTSGTRMFHQNDAAAALRAIEEAGFAIAPKELPEAPGPRYSGGDYSRRNWDAAIEDLYRRDPFGFWVINLEEPRG